MAQYNQLHFLHDFLPLHQLHPPPLPGVPQPATQTKTEAASALRGVCNGGRGKATPLSLARPAPSVAMAGLAARCRTNHNSFDAINRLVQVHVHVMHGACAGVAKVAGTTDKG